MNWNSFKVVNWWMEEVNVEELQMVIFDSLNAQKCQKWQIIFHISKLKSRRSSEWKLKLQLHFPNCNRIKSSNNNNNSKCENWNLFELKSQSLRNSIKSLILSSAYFFNKYFPWIFIILTWTSKTFLFLVFFKNIEILQFFAFLLGSHVHV